MQKQEFDFIFAINSMIKDLISVIVTTYNRPDALNLVLKGLSQQDDEAIEIVIADDGSGSETQKVIEYWQKHCKFRINLDFSSSFTDESRSHLRA